VWSWIRHHEVCLVATALRLAAVGSSAANDVANMVI
jgi:hypothetical protein